MLVKVFTSDLSTKLKVTCGKEPYKNFNCLDILQTHEHICINCFTYLEKLRKAHGWNELSNKPLEPISPSKVKELEDVEGPHIDRDEGNFYRRNMGSIIMVL